MTSPAHTVVVIGGGFSGTMTAVHLLRRASAAPLKVVLFERSARVARGVAYSTASPSHVLNVPAGRMSAFPADDDDFLQFAKARDLSVTGGTFVRRWVYGDYLEATLRQAAHSASLHGATLERRPDEVVAIHAYDGRNGDDGARLTLASGETLQAHHVVLALGNYAPADPFPPLGLHAEGGRYIRDPWAPGALADVDAHTPVLLIGTGLTMLDVAVELASRGRDAPLVAVSRRGLVPLPHRPHGTPPSYAHLPPELIACEPSAVAYLRAIRRHVRLVARDGVDWREVVASLRPVTARLWETLSVRERRAFLRHARPYWDVHRHRVAPELWHVFDAFRRDGMIDVVAARLVGVARTTDGVQVTLRRRGTQQSEQRVFGAVINCTGPESDVRSIDDPLLRQLLATGMVRPDATGLGLDVDARLSLRRRDGSPNPLLSLTGPLLKGMYWEATAVPELRVHAARVAARVSDSLRRDHLGAVAAD